MLEQKIMKTIELHTENKEETEILSNKLVSSNRVSQNITDAQVSNAVLAATKM